jgi:1-pyrroline-5-carboxylate dehydrogenase
MSMEEAGAFHAAFDEALIKVKGEFGAEHSLVIGGRNAKSARATDDRSPNDQRVILGSFQLATQEHADEATMAAKQAYREWSAVSYQERVAILRRAAENFRRDRFELGALLSIEAGKARLEAIGEVEEAADLIDTYCDQIVEHEGYVIKLNQLSSHEVNYSVLRPYGVWAVIAPFNFPVALSTGMIAGALTAGNTVVFKPAHDTPFTGWFVYRMFAEAGVPAGAINFLTGDGAETGKALIESREVDGIVFTGSKEVGYRILRNSILEYPRPCIAEMGGKNPVLVMESADIHKAAVGTARAAFGYGGQKCSAASRAYIHSGVYDDFVKELVEYASTLRVGDPTHADVFMGPVINEPAYRKFGDASAVARRDGRLLMGGSAIVNENFGHGFFVEPTIVDGLSEDHSFFSEELFLPFIALHPVDSLDQALALSNRSEFGLTAGIFTGDESERTEFFSRMQAGVLYANREGGATTGAWPGVQSFGGWKGSGSTGKSALGPYYVQQFMREQSQTTVTGE